AALVAAVKELAGGIEAEAARIVPTSPFLAHEGQLASFADGKNPNAVVETVARIDESSIGGDQYLRAEIAAGESGWQAGNRLPRCEPSLRGVVVEQDNIRAFFLNGIEPAPIRVEVEMPRSVSWRQGDRSRIIGSECTLRLVEFPDKDLVKAQIDVKNEASRRICLDHVSVSPIVAAEGEAARWSVGGPGGSQSSGVLLDVRGSPQPAVRQDRQYRNGA